MKHFRLSWVLALVLVATRLSAQSLADQVDIKYEKHVLKNGLTLLVHEDHKAPIVAINVWYHVGSKDEKPGKSGFAHLFEHLMFNGSENYNKDYFKALGAIGATDLNGTTNNDRTNYFQNVPTSAVDQVLFLESDRMGHLLGAIDQAKLDEQRGVVQNEKRQGENQPYSLVDDEICKILYPATHPYAYPKGTVIGSMEDLNAASLADVQEWFKTYYGPNNATLVLAGDIDLKTAIAKVEKYFGFIPAGPPLPRVYGWVPRLDAPIRHEMEDRVPQTRVYKIWPVAGADHGRNTSDVAHLEVLTALLAQGKTSRLFKRLVYTDQTASNVASYLDDREVSSEFVVFAAVKPGVDANAVEKVLNEEIYRLVSEGPTADELNRVRTQFLANYIRGTERIGGFGGKSDVLAQSQVYYGSADMYKTFLKTIESATPESVKQVAQRWLTPNVLSVTVNPYGKYSNAIPDVERKALPTLGEAPAVNFPNLQRATLKNGLKVVLAERKGVPVLNMSLRLDAGYSSDNANNSGIAALAMNMMDEGTAKRNAIQISEDLANLGANLTTGSGLDVSLVNLNTLKANVDKSLDIMADVVLNPSFPANDFERLKQQQVVQIKNEKTQPGGMAGRVLPRMVYGDNHGYGMMASGFEATVAKLTREDIVKWHQAWVKPGSSTLVVVGDITLAELTAKLEQVLGGWAKGEAPKKNLPAVQLAAKPLVYIVDKPGAIQSQINAAHITVPGNNPEEVAVEMFAKILGSDFNARINMNLREDKHWSYGAFGGTSAGRVMRHWTINAGVQTDKTKESLAEIQKEMNDIVGSRPATEDEFNRVQSDQALQLPGRWETLQAVSGSVAYVLNNGLPDNYFQTYAQKVRSLKLAEVRAVATKVVKPGNLIYVVVGDRAKIEEGIKSLNLGEIRYVDADGNVVK